MSASPPPPPPLPSSSCLDALIVGCVNDSIEHVKEWLLLHQNDHTHKHNRQHHHNNDVSDTNSNPTICTCAISENKKCFEDAIKKGAAMAIDKDCIHVVEFLAAQKMIDRYSQWDGHTLLERIVWDKRNANMVRALLPKPTATRWQNEKNINYSFFDMPHPNTIVGLCQKIWFESCMLCHIPLVRMLVEEYHVDDVLAVLLLVARLGYKHYLPNRVQCFETKTNVWELAPSELIDVSPPSERDRVCTKTKEEGFLLFQFLLSKLDRRKVFSIHEQHFVRSIQRVLNICAAQNQKDHVCELAKLYNERPVIGCPTAVHNNSFHDAIIHSAACKHDRTEMLDLLWQYNVASEERERKERERGGYKTTATVAVTLLSVCSLWKVYTKTKMKILDQQRVVPRDAPISCSASLCDAPIRFPIRCSTMSANHSSSHCLANFKWVKNHSMDENVVLYQNYWSRNLIQCALRHMDFEFLFLLFDMYKPKLCCGRDHAHDNDSNKQEEHTSFDDHELTAMPCGANQYGFFLLRDTMIMYFPECSCENQNDAVVVENENTAMVLHHSMYMHEDLRLRQGGMDEEEIMKTKIKIILFLYEQGAHAGQDVLSPAQHQLLTKILVDENRKIVMDVVNVLTTLIIPVEYQKKEHNTITITAVVFPTFENAFAQVLFLFPFILFSTYSLFITVCKMYCDGVWCRWF